MIIFLLLPFLSAASKLAFSDLQIVGYNLPSRYSPGEISLSKTTVKLDANGLISIMGLRDNEYLCFFREDQLIFPNTPQDQHVGHQREVYDGDEFIWLKFRGFPPQSFLDTLFPVNGVKPSKEALMAFKSNAKYMATLCVKENVSLASKAKDGVSSMWSRWTYSIISTAGVIFIIALIFGIIFFSKPTIPCLDPATREYWRLIYDNPQERDMAQLYLEVEKTCVSNSLNMSEYSDRIHDCLKVLYPEVDPNKWTFFRLYPFPKYLREIPRFNCSLPPHSQ